MVKLISQSNNGIMGGNTSNAISLGTTFGGGLGGLIAGAASGVIDVVAGISSQNNIREGLACFCFIMHGSKGILNQAFGLNVYAASKRPEHPETLLRAAIERTAIEIRQGAFK